MQLGQTLLAMRDLRRLLTLASLSETPGSGQWTIYILVHTLLDAIMDALTGAIPTELDCPAELPIADVSWMVEVTREITPTLGDILSRHV